MNKNLISFLNNSIISKESIFEAHKYVAVLQSELMNLGYMMNEELYNSLCKNNPGDIAKLCTDIIPYIQKALGIGSFKPLHPGFPYSIEKSSNEELLKQQFATYWGTHPKEEEPVVVYKFNFVKFKTLTKIGEKEFGGIFTKLCSVNRALTVKDNEVIEWFLDEYENDYLNSLLPDKIPFKETLCKLASYRLDVPVKTPNDVLRIASFLSHESSDINLPPKYIKTSRWATPTLNQERINRRWDLTRDEKIYILDLLEKVAYANQMISRKRRGMWVTLAHHIGSQYYSKSHPKAYRVLQICRQKKDYPRSFEGTVNILLEEDFHAGIALLASQPGKFLRRFNELYSRARTDKQKSVVCDYFKKVTPKVSSNVLFQMWEYLENRIEDQKYHTRKVWTGKKRQPTYLPELDGLGIELVDELISIIWSALRERAKKLPKLGKCYIDPELKKIPLPTNMKSMTDSLVPVIRGQRMKIDAESKWLRIFLHFPNKKRTSTCIDLSAGLVGDRNIFKVDWTSPKPTDYIIHSGDSYARTGNVAEYIDINLEEAKKSLKYGMVQLNNYTKDSELAESGVCGFSAFDHRESIRYLDPKTIVKSFKCKVPGKTNYLLIDFTTMEYIVADIDFTESGVQIMNRKDILEVVNLYAESPKYSVYDLLRLHVEVRGQQTDKKDTETTNFIFEDFSSDYVNILKWMSI